MNPPRLAASWSKTNNCRTPLEKVRVKMLSSFQGGGRVATGGCSPASWRVTSSCCLGGNPVLRRNPPTHLNFSTFFSRPFVRIFDTFFSVSNSMSLLSTSSSVGDYLISNISICRRPVFYATGRLPGEERPHPKGSLRFPQQMNFWKIFLSRIYAANLPLYSGNIWLRNNFVERKHQYILRYLLHCFP